MEGFGRVGGNGGQLGTVDTCIRVDWRDYTPPTCGRKGGLFSPLLLRDPVGPNNVPEKRKRGCVRARHLLQASRQRVGIAFAAGVGTWERLPWACVAYAPKRPNKQGVYPAFIICLK